MGYAKEYHVERYLREAWIPRLAPVSPQLILCFIAEKVLGLAEVVLSRGSGPRGHCGILAAAQARRANRMATPGISWVGVIWRMVFAVALVLLTFNPSGYASITGCWRRRSTSRPRRWSAWRC